MADYDADANADRDSIYLSIDKLIQKQKAQRKQGKQLTPSIYRVPKILRNVNRLSYKPRVLSIGPFHKENENIKRLEANKVSYVHNLFGRLNPPQDEAMKVCITKVLNRIDQIRSCYEGTTTKCKTGEEAFGGDYKDNNEFAKMMVIDGCFILEVIYASYKKYDSPCSKLETKKYDIHSFFDSNLVSLYVKHDLVLLENQIPFFVLVKLVLEFLEDINPFSEKKLVDNIPSADTNHDHILGLLQKCYQPMDAAGTSLPDHKGLREAALTALSYSAADLSRAGVKFAPNNK